MVARIDAARVGEILIDAGLITDQQLRDALRLQHLEGGLIGRHLILLGAVNRREMYDALAQQWNAPLIDLVAEPPEAGLLSVIGPERLIEAGWVPWKREGAGAIIATTVPPTEQFRADAAELLGVRHISVRTTTDWDLNQAVEAACRTTLLFGASEALATTSSDESAKDGLRRWQLVVPLTIVASIVVGLVVDAPTTLIFLLSAANLIFVMNIGFKVLAGLRAPFNVRAKEKWNDEVAIERAQRGLPVLPQRTPDDELPVYTILVPAYKEANIINKLLANLGVLDYPKSKLEVLVLLEADDIETITAVRLIRPPEYVRLVIVPPGDPQTKPRACNYGLSFARGEFVVIYDAEDRPNSSQLRDTVAAFRRDEFERDNVHSDQRELVCLQGALNYFNADYNVLTRMFAVEYAHWFDAMLPGLDRSHLPIPLGGTSNHFKTKVLRKLGAWDPYNVTEDADLGLRVSAHGYRVGMIEASTGEEACAEVPAWIRQRTRWIKGYIMTAAVNTRHPIRWFKVNGFFGALSLVALIIGTPLAFMLYPLVLGFTVITYIGVRFIGLDLPEWLLVTGMINMLFSNSLMIILSGLAAYKRYNWRIAMFALLNPVYWILHSIAAWRAFWQIVFSPHHWEKTPHGLTEEYEDSAFEGNSIA
ncbi:glycosyltransferase [Alpinimonas psychrophila]|uniref:Cellulose synthase/poly-beta-1,6-N-acetylglucosamine synthase-like glycosyltransferase n=1 Tax=Alpinimonas psychrophila TaxID=748908 RepID=A0A7W3PQ61_9MICO|nr:glycosyltransferase [Alpinimonas psychrophila]MBA8829938.1 cellulose synthase/poly-beta-1,6-N-acetylglucosamine synthase-like glycosyltransferase [Alpinimonas psychrophila]